MEHNTGKPAPAAECTIPAAIGALASLIAKDLSDEDLDLLASVFQQLGDSLSVISAIRSRKAKAG